MTTATLIQNGTAVLPTGPALVDIWLEAGQIREIGRDLEPGTAEVIDASGCLIFPGFIDTHTHMGIPIMDTRSADDFDSGSAAAAWGGVTTILDFTVQAPGQTIREALDERIALATGRSHIDFGVHVNITDQPQAQLPLIPGLVADGFNSFKAFTTYRQAGMMLEWDDFRPVLAAIGGAGGLLMLHAEDNDLIERHTAQHVKAGQFAPIYHPRSRPAAAEAAAIKQAAAIAGEVGARLYIVHLSSAAGLAAGLAARAAGVDIILETCPQYLLLDESRYLTANGHRFITTPPLRTADDVAALWAAVTRGDIDTIGTDHCPFTIAQKELGERQFQRTPNGMPGVATLFPLLYTYGVMPGRISLNQLVALLAGKPAAVFGLTGRKGAIVPGADADLAVWDPDPTTTLRAANIPGGADWSPYEGWQIQGRMRYTLRRGQPLVHDGLFIGHAIHGDLLRAVHQD